MKIEQLIEALEDKFESNDTETCRWCESSDSGVDKDGNPTNDPDKIDCYHFLDCDDDCLERLIPAALVVLRRAVEHPASEPPDDERRVLVCYQGLWQIGQYKFSVFGGLVPLWHIAGVSTVERLRWCELPLVSEVTKCK